MKMRIAFIVIAVLLLVASVGAVENWTYSTPGTYYWVAPAEVTNVVLQISGGGGGGMGGGYWGPSYHHGLGGSAGENGVFTDITVTPGTNYTMVVGPGGAASTIHTGVAHSGSSSSALVHTLAGGVAGTGVDTVGHNGGDGGNGFADTVGNSEAGGNCTDLSYMGGSKGNGVGGGGGGGAGKNLYDYPGAGGRGSDGYIKIFNSSSGGIPSNVPDFVADATTVYPGTMVRFTDESYIYDDSNLTYLWNFGDAATLSTIGNVTHTYAYLGSYTVSLTIGSGEDDSVVKTRELYIIVISEPMNFDTKTEPNPVQFTLVNRNGRALTNVDVTAKMTSSSTDGTNWLNTLFGVPATATSVNETTMIDTTDDEGVVVFPLVAAASYHLTFYNASQGVSDSKEVHPSQSAYVYILASSDTAIATNMADFVTTSLSTYPPKETNPATVYLIGNYSDTSSTTTNVMFYVNFTNGTPVYSTSAGASTLNAQHGVSNVAGVGYYWGLRATSTQFGNVSKAMGITLSGTGEHGLASNLIKVCNNWECT